MRWPDRLRWRELGPRAARTSLRILAATSAFTVLYALYSHVASIVTMREVHLASYDALLAEPDALQRFSTTGSLARAIEGDALHVHGAGELRFEGPTQRLDDDVTVRLRYRPRAEGAYDVYVGLERADGSDARRILARVRLGASPPAIIEGDVGPQGPRRLALRESPVPAADGGLPREGDVHEISLRFKAYIHNVFATLDGAPIASQESRWWMGSPVRLVFGVESREPAAVVDVDLLEAAYDTAERPGRLPPFHDRFAGKIVDPRKWSVILPDGRSAETVAGPEASRGLVIRARSKGVAGFQPAYTLLSPPTPLDAFTLRVRASIRSLHGAALIVGILGTGATPARFADLGVRGDGDKLEALAVGHWHGDAQLSVGAFPGRWKEPEGVLELKYDPSKGELRGWVNGDRVLRETLDLLPGDTTEIRIAVNLQAADAEADVTIEDVDFDHW